MATTPRTACRKATCTLISLCVLLSPLLISALENAAHTWTSVRKDYGWAWALDETYDLVIGECEMRLRIGQMNDLRKYSLMQAVLRLDNQDGSAAPFRTIAEIPRSDEAGGPFTALT